MATWYVSPSGSNGAGSSWATAWTDTANIAWGSVASGDVIYLDGGTTTSTVSPYDFGGSSPNPGVNCGQSYSAFTVGTSGVTIMRSRTAGRNGTVVISGGRLTPLPYAGQATYSAATGATAGIALGATTGVTIDGQDRSGIIIRGANDTGIDPGTGGGHTFRNIEIFDCGYPTTLSNGTYNSNGWGVQVNAACTYDRMLVHDNGQDEFHPPTPAVTQGGSSWTNCWMGAMRAHPTYNYEPFNDLQVADSGLGTTHADCIQIFSPDGVQPGALTADHCVFGPGCNTGWFPSDGGNLTAFNDCSVTNCLFMTVSHDFEQITGITGWTIANCTMFQPGPTSSVGQNIDNTGSCVMTNCIVAGGFIYMPGSWTGSSGNLYYGTTSSLPGGVSANPGFASAPSLSAYAPLATLFTSNFTPSAPYGSYGSPLVSVAALMSRIDTLNGTQVTTSKVPLDLYAAFY